MAKEKIEQLNYQFIAVPKKLMIIMDNDCFKLISLLIDEYNYWKSCNKLENGYFYKSIEELQKILFMKNKQDVRLTIEALHINKLIDVKTVPNHPHKFKVNWEKILEYDSIKLLDLTKFYQPITKLKRGIKCTF